MSYSDLDPFDDDLWGNEDTDEDFYGYFEPESGTGYFPECDDDWSGNPDDDYDELL